MNAAHAGRRGWFGYDTRAWRSALVMAAVDALRPGRRSKPFVWGESVVVSSIAGLGDFFIHLPLIAGIVAECRRREIPVRVALRPSMAGLGQRCGWDVLPFDNALAEFFKAPGEVRPQELFRRLRHARDERPDLWIDLSANAVNALLLKLAGASRIAGRVSRGGRSLIDHALPHEIGENEYANRERIAAALGCELDFSVFESMRTKSPLPGATVLSITTACRWRSWPLANFLEIVRAFPSTRFALTGFSREIGEDERAAFAELAAQPNVTDFLDRLSLDEMIGLVAHAGAVVTNDTSTAHIANAFARPGAVLFGPENSNVFAAVDGLRVFHDRTCPLYPCVQWRCGNQADWCMTKISASSVIAHLATLLRHERSPSPAAGVPA